MLQMIQAAADAATIEAQSAREHSPVTTPEPAAVAIQATSGVCASQQIAPASAAAESAADISSLEREPPQALVETTGSESMPAVGSAVAPDGFVEAAQAAMTSLDSAAPKRKSMLRQLSWRRSRASSRAS